MRERLLQTNDLDDVKNIGKLILLHEDSYWAQLYDVDGKSILLLAVCKSKPSFMPRIHGKLIGKHLLL